MIFYWIALPLCALSTAGLVLMTTSATWIATAGKGNFLVWLAFSAALTLLVIWRLWVHDRARRRVAPSPSAPPTPDADA